MPVPELLLSSWFFAGATVALLWSSAIVLLHGRRGFAPAFAMAAAALWLLTAFAAGSGLLQGPGLLLWSLPFILSIGPVAYVWLMRRVLEQEPQVFWHGIIPTSAFVLALISVPGSILRLPVEVLPALQLTAKSSVFVYFSWIILRISLNLDQKGRKAHRRLLLLLAVLVIDLLLGIHGQISGERELTLLSAALLPAILFVAFVMNLKYPDVWLALREDMQKLRYVKSRLGSLDLEGVLERMQHIMQEERAFLDEDYSMPRFAAEIGISLHQLSEILNEKLGLSFYNYINRFRIQEATRLILEDSQRSILSIAFAVGFNSRSAFHRAFRRETSKSPAEFRKAQLKRR